MEITLRSKINKAAGILGAALALGVTSNAWSALPLENPLGDSYYSVISKPRIDFTNVALSYTSKSQTFSGKNWDGKSTFKLIKPDGSSTSFNSTFSLTAKMTSTGAISPGGTFSFKSSDSMFGFGKDSRGRAITGTVFAGSLNSFGWSKTNYRVEFGTGNFTGWACTQGWCTQSERIYFRMNDKTLDINKCMSSVTAWSNKASGSAVIPVPAAAWLFGSGLIGLVGVARRKKKA